MSAPIMDPQYEQRLRDEVIYLHSLWHQGPPRPPSAAAATPHHLQPSNTTQFKKEPRGKRGKKFQKNPNRLAPDSKSSPGVEWPCPSPPPPPLATSGWPSSVGRPVQLPLLPSPEEQSKLAARQAQNKALKTVREFFRSNNADSESDSIDSSSDEDDEFMEEDDGRYDYTFFLKVFMEDTELKEYYEKKFVKGEFSCLICGAVGGKNTGKRFKGCLALVQHSISIAKTKKRRAHRAYGQAVCKVLGWDIDRLPTIVSLLSDNSGEVQGNVDSGNKDNSICLVNNVESGDGNGEVVPENATICSGSVPSADEGIMNSLMAADANNTLEGLGMVHPFNVEETVTVADGLTSNSLTAADANNTLEGLGMVNSFNVKETVAEGLTSGSLNENSGVEMGIAILDGLKEDDKIED